MGLDSVKIEDRLHTVAEVAKIFSVSTDTVRLWIKKKKIDAFKPEGAKSWQISREAMARFANTRKD